MERLNTAPLSMGMEMADVYALQVSGLQKNIGRIEFLLEIGGASVRLTNLGYGKAFPLIGDDSSSCPFHNQ